MRVVDVLTSRSCRTCAVTFSLLAAAAGSNARHPPLKSSETTLGCGVNNPSCLAAVRGDLDRDGLPDTATLTYNKLLGFYFVHVTTSAGRDYVPMAGSYDPRHDKVSLKYRSSGDVRCRHWVQRKLCGHAISDMFPEAALFLSHSRDGDFALFLMFPNIHRTRDPGGRARTDGEFMIVPALDGPVTDDVTPARP